MERLCTKKIPYNGAKYNKTIYNKIRHNKIRYNEVTLNIDAISFFNVTYIPSQNIKMPI